MAHYKGTVQGNGSPASRLGTKSSGMEARADGWNIGGAVDIRNVEGEDVVRFAVTGGSNRTGAEICFAEVRHSENGRRILHVFKDGVVVLALDI